ncbi:hypothetical protein FN846DRAFT_989229 [Sphaerosporella brunnea]|uniref:Uncharacterized protein n=1 Tax=Sphaerosporella brunnea TaxID=1250544 RepID=A0A5J5ER91_9PEZI|nr:hypothetical protein FN846DRAFT_989229 [Sphaerosporella brunnea]
MPTAASGSKGGMGTGMGMGMGMGTSTAADSSPGTRHSAPEKGAAGQPAKPAVWVSSARSSRGCTMPENSRHEQQQGSVYTPLSPSPSLSLPAAFSTGARIVTTTRTSAATAAASSSSCRVETCACTHAATASFPASTALHHSVSVAARHRGGTENEPQRSGATGCGPPHLLPARRRNERAQDPAPQRERQRIRHHDLEDAQVPRRRGGVDDGRQQRKKRLRGFVSECGKKKKKEKKETGATNGGDHNRVDCAQRRRRELLPRGVHQHRGRERQLQIYERPQDRRPASAQTWRASVPGVLGVSIQKEEEAGGAGTYYTTCRLRGWTVGTMRVRGRGWANQHLAVAALASHSGLVEFGGDSSPPSGGRSRMPDETKPTPTTATATATIRQSCSSREQQRIVALRTPAQLLDELCSALLCSALLCSALLCSTYTQREHFAARPSGAHVECLLPAI